MKTENQDRVKIAIDVTKEYKEGKLDPLKVALKVKKGKRKWIKYILLNNLDKNIKLLNLLYF